MRNLWINKHLSILLPWLFFSICLAQTEINTEDAAAEVNIQDQVEVDPDEAYYREVGQQILPALKALRAYQPEKALELIAKADVPEGMTHLFTGWAEHQRGNYDAASKHLHMVDKEVLKDDGYFNNRLDELLKTSDELKDFKILETENFSFRYQEGRDQVMLNFLPDILERVYARFAEIFQYQRDEKIIVELMPDYKLFSYASALTRKQIETTGTIALCVENRLVVLTPRRVAQGYYWPDVIAHEFVHYILTKMSEDHVPLWMQEGTAKYFEARWESDNVEPLDEGMESSIAYALKEDILIGVEQMMPSFAALPTAAMARQAYAQTTTMIDYISKTKGEETVRKLILGLKQFDGDMDAVMTRFLGRTFEEFENDWKAWLPQQGYQEHQLQESMGVTLLDDDKAEEKVAAADVDDTHKKHLRLGDLLLERNRYSAALKQYQKIDPEKGRLDRQIVLRMLECNRQLDQQQAIVDLIDNYIPKLQDDTTMLIFKAGAELALGQPVQAEALLNRALRINPFNPGIYRLMLEIKGENAEEAQIYREALNVLTNQAQAAPKDRKS